MPFEHIQGIRYYTFEIFSGLNLRQGVFTRRGGVSPSPWESLNVGGTVGDERSRVLENRRRSLQALEIATDSVIDSWQVHGNAVVVAECPRGSDSDLCKADGILTPQANLTLMMRFADCVPIFLFDPGCSAIGLVHAGWKGTLLDVVGAAVRRMSAEFGSDPADILAGIGPSIGPDHYEVGDEIISKVGEQFEGESDRVLRNESGRTFMNLWEANRILLGRAGVRSIEIAGICTACNLGDWFSHRAEAGVTGRFAAIIQRTG